jgi:hypothetical protein
MLTLLLPHLISDTMHVCRISSTTRVTLEVEVVVVVVGITMIKTLVYAVCMFDWLSKT